MLDGGLKEAQIIKHGILTYEDYEKGMYGDMFYHNLMAQFTARAVYIGGHALYCGQRQDVSVRLF